MNLFRNIKNNFLNRLSPQSILMISFGSVILIGAVLLMLPFTHKDQSISFVDALFTSSSATCVTGLIVVDTGSFFTFWGQLIILTLIQIGGLGVMSFSTLFLFFLRGKLGIGGRAIVEETFSQFDHIDLSKLLRAVFRFTFIFEFVGAILLFFRFNDDMPWTKALYTSVFHSISAFCNAGFSLFPDSLIKYQGDLYINSVIMLLIISGGIGFIVMYEVTLLRKRNFRFHNISLHSRIVIITSAALILIGAILFLLFDYSIALKEFSFPKKVLISFFQSVTTRTAGFNSIDIFSISMPSLLLFVILMFIGASPASCGGGIKTVTLAVIIVFIRSKIADAKNVNILYRTIPFKIISKAIVIIVFGVLSILVFTLFITAIEIHTTSFSHVGSKFIQILFEVVSAFGTVGLSTGITANLAELSKILLAVLMFMGRLGPLTVAVAIGSKEKIDIKYAEDNLIVG